MSMENKKLTPLEFVDYLKGFMGITGIRPFTLEEVGKMKDLLDSVSIEHIHYDPAMPPIEFHHSPSVGSPDWHFPTNINFNYTEK